MQFCCNKHEKIDSRWKQLGKYLPDELKAKAAPKGGDVNANLSVYMYSWQYRQWRHSKDLFEELGEGMSMLRVAAT